MRRTCILIMMVVLSFAVTGVANAADGLATVQELTRSVESFDFFIEGSSGMNEDHLGNVLRQINDEIPELGYPQSGIHTFAPESTVLGFEPYKRSSFADGIDKLMKNFPGGKNTSLGKGFDNNGPMYSDMLRPGAVIVFTDGDYGNGRDSLNEAYIFYLTQPDMCLHFVSFAKSEEAQNLIDDMAAINDCAVSVLATELVSTNGEGNPDNIKKFVKDVFYDSKPPSVSPPPIFSLPFAFDSAALSEQTVKLADAVAEYMKANPKLHLKTRGYTCILGPVAYNLNLSKRRAEAVRNYIINAGIEPSRVEAEGFGIANPFKDNSTRDGRTMNRRVEFTFSEPGAENNASQ